MGNASSSRQRIQQAQQAQEVHEQQQAQQAQQAQRTQKILTQKVQSLTKVITDFQEKQKEVNLIIKRDGLMDKNHILIKVPPEGGEVIIPNKGAMGTSISSLLEQNVHKIECAPEDTRHARGIRTFTVHSHDGITTNNVTHPIKSDKATTVATMELTHPYTTQYIKYSYCQLNFSGGSEGLLFKLAPHVGVPDPDTRTEIEMKPRLAAGGSLALLRQDILRTELQLGKRDIAARRTYNAKVGKVHQLT